MKVIENPTTAQICFRIDWQKYDQLIQPYMFGEPERQRQLAYGLKDYQS